MKKLLAVAPSKTNLGGVVSASASLGNNPLEDRSAPASAVDDIPASMAICPPASRFLNVLVVKFSFFSFNLIRASKQFN